MVLGGHAAQGTIVMPDEPPLSTPVARAGNGDNQVWDMLGERCAPVVWSICRVRGVSSRDADDAGQCTWLRLVKRIDTAGEAAELQGWLAVRS